jgi:hypothetical protein
MFHEGYRTLLLSYDLLRPPPEAAGKISALFKAGSRRTEE